MENSREVVMPPDFTVPCLLQSPQKHTGLFQSKGFKETMVYMPQASVISWKCIYTHTHSHSQLQEMACKQNICLWNITDRNRSAKR